MITRLKSQLSKFDVKRFVTTFGALEWAIMPHSHPTVYWTLVFLWYVGIGVALIAPALLMADLLPEPLFVWLVVHGFWGTLVSVIWFEQIATAHGIGTVGQLVYMFVKQVWLRYFMALAASPFAAMGCHYGFGFLISVHYVRVLFREFKSVPDNIDPNHIRGLTIRPAALVQELVNRFMEVRPQSCRPPVITRPESIVVKSADEQEMIDLAFAECDLPARHPATEIFDPYRPWPKSNIPVTYPLGGVRIPRTLFAPHTILLGETGAGKTVKARAFLGQALVHHGGGLRYRAVVFDATTQFGPLLVGMGVEPELIVNMNPFDARSTMWDMAADVDTDADIVGIVTSLLPESDSASSGVKHGGFFNDAVRSVTFAVIKVFHEIAPGRWTFNDVIEAVQTQQDIRRVLTLTRSGRKVYERHFTDSGKAAVDQEKGVMGSIETRLIRRFETIAHLWSRARYRISFKAWRRTGGVVLLGHDMNQASLAPMNRAMLLRLSGIVNDPSGPDDPSDESWFVLDELDELGYQPELPNLLSFGREKGARCLLSTQDIHGLFNTYGQNLANKIIGQCGNVAALRLNGATAELAAKYFGDHESWDDSFSVTQGKETSNTKSTGRKQRPVILGSEFASFPLAGPDNGIYGYFATPELGVWGGQKNPIPWAFFANLIKAPDVRTMPKFIRRSPEDYRENPWGPADLRRLGLTDGDDRSGGDGSGLRTMDW